jgi:hypothetical protein
VLRRGTVQSTDRKAQRLDVTPDKWLADRSEQLRSARFDRQARRMSTSLSTLAQPEKEKTSTDQDDGARFQVSFPAPNLL